MDFYDAERVAALLPWDRLVEGIATMLATPGVQSPARHMHTVSDPDADGQDLLLLMPAWVPGDVIGVKVITFFESNSRRGLPAHYGTYLLLDGTTGRALAVLDGEELGSRRTMAASALAARSLARPDADHLLVVGTGQLAPHAVAAHAFGRDLSTIEVWGRRPDAAAGVVEQAAAMGIEAAVALDLDDSVGRADIISCVTSASAPLIRGALLRPGTHLDLVGSFKPDMRESDDECARRATIFVDTVEGAAMSGDIASPVEAGIFTLDDIAADLAALATGDHPGRSSAAEITLFKSAGFAIEDLAAARIIQQS